MGKETFAISDFGKANASAILEHVTSCALNGSGNFGKTSGLGLEKHGLKSRHHEKGDASPVILLRGICFWVPYGATDASAPLSTLQLFSFPQ